MGECSVPMGTGWFSWDYFSTHIKCLKAQMGGMIITTQDCSFGTCLIAWMHTSEVNAYAIHRESFTEKNCGNLNFLDSLSKFLKEITE